VRELENRLSSRELSEWMAFSTIEPFGETQADYRAGLIASATANASGNYKKALTPSDFIYIYKQPKQMSMIDRRQEQERQMSMFKSLAGVK
jgi:hypothetical protein